MGFPTAELSSGQYTLVRGNHKTHWHAILNDNQVVFKCRVNQSSFDDSFAEIIFDTVTVGAYTAAVEGYTVLISHTDDQRAAFFRGRVRKPATSDTLYINETSLAVADNDYVWIIRDVQLWERYPHKDEATGEIKLDYDKSYEQLPPIIRGVPSVVYGKLSSGVFDVAFTPTALATTFGATISAWASSLNGGSYQAGSSSTQNFTARFTAAGRYFVRISATDSGGRVGYFFCRVLVNDANDSIIAKGVEISSISGAIGEGWNASLTVNSGSDVTSVIDQTEVYIVSEETWADGTTAPILSNVRFIGRLRAQDDAVRMARQTGRSSTVSYQVDGMGAQMGKLILASIAMRRIASPAVFGEIKALTLWRALTLVATQLTNLATIAALSFSDETEDYGVPLLGTETRSVGDTAQDTSFAINALLNYASSGEIEIDRHIQYLSGSDKAALPIVANFTLRDTGRAGGGDLIHIQREHILQIGRVVGFGGSYNTSSGETTALRAFAPARVFSSGAGRSQFNNQVLKVNLALSTMKDELALRTGADYAAKNKQTIMPVEMPGAYQYLQPHCALKYTWTLPSSATRTGQAFTTADEWYLQSVTLSYFHTESRAAVQARFVLDTANIAARVIAEIAPDDIPYQVPAFLPFGVTPFPMLESLKYPDGADIPPEDEQPFSPEEVQRATSPTKRNTDPEREQDIQDKPEVKQGSVVMTWNAGGVWICDNFAKTSSPAWRAIAPAGSGITNACFNPHNAGAYVLNNDGTHSYIWRTANALSPAWQGTTIADTILRLIKPASSNGKVYAYAPNGNAALNLDFDFTVDDGGWTIPNPPNRGAGGYLAGTGFQANDSDTVSRSVMLRYDLGTTYTLTNVVFTFSASGATYAGGDSKRIILVAANGTTALLTQDDVITNGSGQTYSWSGTQANVRYVQVDITVDQVAPLTGSGVITSASITGVDTSDDAVSAYSNDGGASFGGLVSVGDSPGSEGGFDTLRVGSTVFGASDGLIRQATDGGEYTDTTGGESAGTYTRCIWALGQGADSFIMGTAAAVGGETLWLVSGGTPSAITPNDGSNDGIVVSEGAICAAPENDEVIFALCNFGGTVKLARSTNGGASWQFTTGINAGAKWVRAKNANQVYIANNNNILYSEDGGASFVEKAAPGSGLLGLEVR